MSRQHMNPSFQAPAARALSVRQPWAWLIVHGWKNIENRDWPTRVRGRVLIHAGRALTKEDYLACQLFIAGFSELTLPPIEKLERGGIVGETNLLDCVSAHPSEWFCGRYGFVLADSKPLPFRPCSGRLGFFQVAEETQTDLPL